MKIKIFKVDKNKYKLVKSNCFDKTDKLLVDLAKTYDRIGYIDKSVGEEIEKLFIDPEYIIGVHYTENNTIDHNYIDDIFMNGIINRKGDSKDTIISEEDLNIEETIELCNNPVKFHGKLKAAHYHNGSKGCFVVKIPKSYLGLEEGDVKPIYYTYYCEQPSIRLSGEFVYGYVPVDENGKVGSFINNRNYTDHHTNPYTLGTMFEGNARQTKKK